MVENPRSGEQIEFESSSPELLVMWATWTRPGHRTIEHVHPHMEERFEIIGGVAAFCIEGERRDAAPGDVVVVSPGSRHQAWNPSSAPVRLRIEMRPALRWQEFTERLFNGEEPATLLREFRREVTL